MHARPQASLIRAPRSRACTSKSSHQALPARTATAAAQGSDAAVEQHTDHSNDQAKLIQKLRKEAYEAGYKAGYQQGVQVQVSVSIDLDDDSGSYLRKSPGGRSGSSANGSNGSNGNGSSIKQPWLPPGRAAAQGTAQAAPRQAPAVAVQDTNSSSSSQAGDSIARSAVKGLVWRIFSTTVTVGVAMVILKDSLEVSDALKFGGIEFATKYVMYFLHERLWAAVALL